MPLGVTETGHDLLPRAQVVAELTGRLTEDFGLEGLGLSEVDCLSVAATDPHDYAALCRQAGRIGDLLFDFHGPVVKLHESEPELPTDTLRVREPRPLSPEDPEAIIYQGLLGSIDLVARDYDAARIALAGLAYIEKISGPYPVLKIHDPSLNVSINIPSVPMTQDRGIRES